MISNKILITLMLVILGIISTTSASTNDAPRIKEENRHVLQVKRRRITSKTQKNTTVLQDTCDEVREVQPEVVDLDYPGVQSSLVEEQTSKSSDKSAPILSQNGCNNTGDISLRGTNAAMTSSTSRLPSLREEESAAEKFERFLKHGKYWRAWWFIMTTTDYEVFKSICPTVKTLEQYNGIIGCLKSRRVVANFFVYGNIEIVKKAVIASSVYSSITPYVMGGNLETAIILALLENLHDRVIELLVIRLEAYNDRMGFFMHQLFWEFAPEKNSLPLKKFLTLRGDEFKNGHPHIYDIFCKELVCHLMMKLKDLRAQKLMIGLIGQPSLLTSEIFTVGFFNIYPSDLADSNFINYGWREVIQEILTKEQLTGHGCLWNTMKKLFPNQFIGECPHAEEEFATVLKHIPTKRQREIQWIKENTPSFLKRLKELAISSILPIVLVKIVFEYAKPKPTTWLDV